jgi:hypothetical protein
MKLNPKTTWEWLLSDLRHWADTRSPDYYAQADHMAAWHHHEEIFEEEDNVAT